MPKDTSSGGVVHLNKTGSRILTSAVFVQSCKFYVYATLVEYSLARNLFLRTVKKSRSLFIKQTLWVCRMVFQARMIQENSFHWLDHKENN